MIENLPIKVDDVGRIVIPKKVRKELNININDILLLSTNNEKIELTKKENEEEKNLLKKVKNIYKQTNLNIFLLKENKTIYSSKKEKLLKEKQDNGYKYKTKNPYIYCEIKLNNYTKYELLITYENKEEENLASLICEILS